MERQDFFMTIKVREVFVGQSSGCLSCRFRREKKWVKSAESTWNVFSIRRKQLKMPLSVFAGGGS